MARVNAKTVCRGERMRKAGEKKREPYNSSIFGWKMRFTKPMLGLL